MQVGVRSRIGILLSALAITSLVGATLAGATARQKFRGNVEIVTLSNRADLISGDEALVRVLLPEHASLRNLTVRLGDRNISRSFGVRGDGSIEGLVTGLKV